MSFPPCGLCLTEQDGHTALYGEAVCPCRHRKADAYNRRVAAPPRRGRLSGMGSPQTSFQEANLWSVAIRDLGLTIAGTALEPILREFEDELAAAGIGRLRPTYYL